MAENRLLIVDNSLDPELYRPVEHWTGMVGYEPDSIHMPTGGRLPDTDQHTHVILTGCEGSILDMPGWARDEADWLKEAVDAGTRILGSCWGHQLIAVAFAGLAGVRRAAAPEFGWVEVPVWHDGGILPSGTIQTFTSHFDEVTPGCHPDLLVLAGTPGCAVQAARWGDRPVWGIQPHPEILPDTGREFLTAALEKWPDSSEHLEKALAGPVLDSGAGKSIVARFLGPGEA